MRILFLAHRIPYPPNKGEKIRGYHVIGAPAERHEVSLVCWVDAADLKDLLIKPGEEILVGDAPEKFAREVVRLIQDRALYERIAKKARSRVLEPYDWKTVGFQLKTITEWFSSKTPETDPGSEKRSSL
jgi:hypothetical protein